MASGDLTYEHNASGTLTNQQRTDLGTLVAALWPGALVDLLSVTFARIDGGVVAYSLRGDRSVAPAVLPLPVTVKARLP